MNWLRRLPVPPVTLATIIVLASTYIVAGLAVNFVPSLRPVVEALPIRASQVLSGEVWRVLTYALLHDLSSPWHMLMNCLMIWFFGAPMEQRWGTGRSLVFMLLTVVAGGIAVVVAGAMGLGTGGAVGASGYTEGLLVAWGLTFKDAPVRLFFAIPMRGIHMVYLALALWLLDAVSSSPVSAAAHAGGIVMAFILVRGLWAPNRMRAAWWALLEKLGLKKKPKLYVVPKPGDKWIH